VDVEADGAYGIPLLQQVVLYATMVTKSDLGRSLLDNHKITVYEKENTLYFIIAEFRGKNTDQKPSEIATLTAEKFADYLMDEGLDRWSMQPVDKLEGKRNKGNGSDQAYLSFDKKLRHISSPNTYAGFFGDLWYHEMEAQDLVDHMPKCTPLTIHR